MFVKKYLVSMKATYFFQKALLVLSVDASREHYKYVKNIM